ncbi:MAG: hypothetical protein J5I65_09625 [Aridibacter famidurans]|nr:hypothetical protein [Aridibacter famidurans]
MHGALVKLVRLSVLLSLFLLTQTGHSLDRSRTITQFHHTKWTSRDGAPSQVVALAQTTDGFLWIGTSRGLFRFDGVRFERFVPSDGTELPSDNIYALTATGDGGLWVSFRPTGLGFVKDGVMQVFTRKEHLPRSQIYCFGIDGKNRVWAGTHDGLALRRADGGWDEIGKDWGFAPKRVRTMLTDRQGTMWVAVDETIVKLEKGSDRFQETGEIVNIITALAESPDGRIWKGEAFESLRPVSAARSGAPGYGIKFSRYVGGVLFDSDGTLWFTDEDGIKRLRNPLDLDSDILSVKDPRLEVLDLGDDLSGPILEDHEGNIWIGTPQGLHRFRYSYFVPNKASSRYRNMTLLADPVRGVWVGSSLQLPLAHIDGESVRMFPDAMYISSVYRDFGGTVWWGRHSRLLKQVGDEITPFVQPSELTSDWIWEVYPGHEDGHMWASAGDSGIVSFEDGQWGKRQRLSGLPDRGPSASFPESPGRTWLGYTENRVVLVENGIAKMFTFSDGIELGRIRVIRKGGGRVWVGGELGLALFDGSRFHSIETTNGGRFGTVSGIVFSRDGAMWLNEVQGVVRIPEDQVRAIVSNPGHRTEFRQFDSKDGLPGAPQMNWTVSTAVESADGRLWFATDGGLASIEPDKLIENPLPPPVSIRSLNAGEKQYDVNRAIELPQGTEDLSIEYTALSLSIPERVQFRYLLEGVDSEWRDAHSRREAFYTNLGPGEYRFRVIASNNDGVWNDEGAVLVFRILPMFYQTNWFLALCVLGAAGIVILGVRWRLEQLKYRMRLQFEERLAERGRIAQDLHDTLLQGFVSASMHMDVAVDSLPEPSPERRRFERLHEMIKRLISEGRETVKGLKSNGITDRERFEELFFEMREEFDIDHSVEFRPRVGDLPGPLHPIIGEEVRRIAHEAVFNAFRHADASSIEATLEYSARRLILSVRDDGRGIEPDIAKLGREGHWGLTGMRERAEKIGGKLKVWSSNGRGTEIQLSVPGRVAFVRSDPGPVLRILERAYARFRRVRPENK